MSEAPFEGRANLSLSMSIKGGKSAVMTAVMIGLGSSAVTTSRGQSLKCFVKNGERYVRINLLIYMY